MELLVIWLVVAAVAAIVASNKGRSGAGWFVVCLFLPILIIIVLALPTRRQPQSNPTVVIVAPNDLAAYRQAATADAPKHIDITPSRDGLLTLPRSRLTRGR